MSFPRACGPNLRQERLRPQRSGFVLLLVPGLVCVLGVKEVAQVAKAGNVPGRPLFSVPILGNSFTDVKELG